MPDLCVLKLFTMYATDEQMTTDGQTKVMLTAPFPTGGDKSNLRNWLVVTGKGNEAKR